MQKAWHDAIAVVIFTYLPLVLLLMRLSQEPGYENETDMLVDRDVNRALHVLRRCMYTVYSTACMWLFKTI